MTPRTLLIIVEPHRFGLTTLTLGPRHRDDPMVSDRPAVIRTSCV
jgi:hypothetical protein